MHLALRGSNLAYTWDIHHTTELHCPTESRNGLEYDTPHHLLEIFALQRHRILFRQ
jgi:hypothetical protein